MTTIRKIALAITLSLSFTGASLAEVACDPAVQKVMDQQRQDYINAYNDLAQQNFSQRPGSFASTTCLDNLMQGGGMDIFFKPPSLDNIFNMVKNLACEQASQIFNQVLGNSGLNAASVLNPGELIKGVNMGGNASGISSALTGSIGVQKNNTAGIGVLMK